MLTKVSRTLSAVSNFDLPIIQFKDGMSTILYCPHLDLSGYGKTIKEAEVSFDTNLKIYIQYTTEKNTLEADLKKLGWGIFPTGIRPPDYLQLARANRDLKDILNRRAFTQKRKMITLPLSGWQKRSEMSG